MKRCSNPERIEVEIKARRPPWRAFEMVKHRQGYQRRALQPVLRSSASSSAPHQERGGHSGSPTRPHRLPVTIVARRHESAAAEGPKVRVGGRADFPAVGIIGAARIARRAAHRASAGSGPSARSPTRPLLEPRPTSRNATRLAPHSRGTAALPLFLFTELKLFCGGPLINPGPSGRPDPQQADGRRALPSRRDGCRKRTPNEFRFGS
jgi:hypothetical protein